MNATRLNDSSTIEAVTWRAIPGYDGYEASTDGQIRSIDRIVPTWGNHTRFARGRILSPYVTKGNGYLSLCMGRGRAATVHSLIAATYLGPRPEGMQVCHNDGDMYNNTPGNLRYDSASENGYDQVEHGRHFNRSKTHCPRGHLLEMPNLVRAAWEKLGHRNCLACSRTAGAKRTKKVSTEQEFQRWADRKYLEIVA